MGVVGLYLGKINIIVCWVSCDEVFGCVWTVFWRCLRWREIPMFSWIDSLVDRDSCCAREMVYRHSNYV